MIAYFDCFAGAAGDMIVGALLDAGADISALQTELDKLHLHGYSLKVDRANRCGIQGTKFDVSVDGDEDHSHAHHHPHRGLSDILKLIDDADLAPRAAERASKVFKRLGHAEAKVHGCTPDEVHFHEVGAVDSIVDIIGACVALELLGVDSLYCSVIPLGSGTVKCAHGTMPVPAPATAELLKGFATCQGVCQGEMTTPTAAALLTALCENIGEMPEMQLGEVGYGAGTRDDDHVPNMLRVLLGDFGAAATADCVVQLSANIDDCSGEILGATIDALLTSGCLDAWASPITMKKSRPAWQLCALCSPSDVDAAERIIFTETTTFGIRRKTCRRTKLTRSHVVVPTEYGDIRVSEASLSGEIVTVSPEFADCHAAATTHHVAIRQTMDAARDAYQCGHRRPG